MKVRKIVEDGYNLKSEMKKFGYTFRSLEAKTGLGHAYLHKISQGKIVVSEEQATFIKNCMVEPTPTTNPRPH